MDSVGFAPPDVRATCELLLCPSLPFAVSSPADGRSIHGMRMGRPLLNQQGAAHGWWKVHQPLLWSLAPPTAGRFTRYKQRQVHRNSTCQASAVKRCGTPL